MQNSTRTPPIIVAVLLLMPVSYVASYCLQRQMPRCMIHHEDPTGTNTFTLKPLQK